MLPPVPPANATTPNLLYASPSQTVQLPLGTKFDIAIKVANFDPFNGWDIHVRTNSSVINPIALTIIPNYFSANQSGSSPTELANCINGLGTPSPNCFTDPFVGKGIVRSAVSYISTLTSQGGSGLLFTITYNVTGFGFSNISIFDDTIPNGRGPVSHTTLPGTFGSQTTRPDLTIGATPTDLVLTLSRSYTVSINATIAVTSIDNLAGPVRLSAKSALSVSLYPSSVMVVANATSYSTLMVLAANTTQSTRYFVNVTATIGSISSWQILSILVEPPPDFVMSVTPSILKIHETNSGTSIITLDTQTGFSGSIHLKMDVPPVPGLIASLGATDLSISPGQPATTLFAVRTPPSDFPFKYLINITASSTSASTHPPLVITVRSPSPDYTFLVGTASYVVQAGQSRTFTLNATSVDYFRGQLFLVASSLSGIREVFSRSSISLDFGNSSTTLMTITTDSFLALGNHVINVTSLGNYFLGTPVNHSIMITITVVSGSVAGTILGLQPTAYFGILGALWLGLIGVAIKEFRKEKPKRFLS